MSPYKRIRRLLPVLITPGKTAQKETKHSLQSSHIAIRCMSCMLLRFISVKPKWWCFDHRFNWDQTQTLSLKSSIKSSSRIYRDYHSRTCRARLSSSFHRLKHWLPVSRNRESLRSGFIERPWMQKSIEHMWVNFPLQTHPCMSVCGHLALFGVCWVKAMPLCTNQHTKCTAPHNAIVPSQLKRNLSLHLH